MLQYADSSVLLYLLRFQIETFVYESSSEGIGPFHIRTSAGEFSSYVVGYDTASLGLVFVYS